MDHASAISAPSQTESANLKLALGRILAHHIVADCDLPPFHRSTRDGFAVTAAQITSGHPAHIIGTVRAGTAWSGVPLRSREAVTIMTGAPVPAGADAVLMIEHAIRSGDKLTLASGREISAGDNIVAQGAEARGGDILLCIGTKLTPAEIALAATCGVITPTVFVQPKVAIFSTGDELVDAANTPLPAQIRNSNAPALAAMVQSVGGTTSLTQNLPDNTEAIAAALQTAIASSVDLLLLSGGVSVGEYDLVEAALARLGAEFLFTGVTMQPGKPVVFGRIAQVRPRPLYFFGLPGNPVSVQVCFLLFVQLILAALAGAAPSLPRFALATLDEDLKTKPGLTKFLPAFISSTWDSARVRRVPWQGSGDLTANARVNCYLVIPQDCEQLTRGAIVSVLLR